MVITNKRIKVPETFTFNDITIKCVNELKLLGVTIDNKLGFNAHFSIISHTVNSKLFSIKRIFYLATSVHVENFVRIFLTIYSPNFKTIGEELYRSN